MKQLALLAILALILAVFPLTASASDRPDRHELHANAECARLGAFIDRNGLTQREIEMAKRHHCVKIFTGEWFSDRWVIVVVG